MSNEDIWATHRHEHLLERQRKRYVVFCAEAFVDMATRLENQYPDRFKYYETKWGKYPDGTDNIRLDGFHPNNEIAGQHVLFLASFHNNDVTLSQFSVLIVLLQSFIESLTIVLPFYPVGTNERVEIEGSVATANTYSILLSNLPTIGRPNRLMIYDIHTLQNRFYFNHSTIPSLHTTMSLLFQRLQSTDIKTVAFPDDGAKKRFELLFKREGFEIIVCGKVRDGDRRIVTVQDGDPRGKNVVIVDDLVQTGGTLYECAQALRTAGAIETCAYVAHGVFPHGRWKDFSKKLGGRRAVFEKFWLTNSQPTVCNQLPTDDVFEVMDLLPQIISDLDMK